MRAAPWEPRRSQVEPWTEAGYLALGETLSVTEPFRWAMDPITLR
ncbi:hypothetical protein [Micromonospora sp. LA-10]